MSEGEIRVVAGRSPQHSVLVVPERGGPQPERALRLVPALEPPERALDRAALAELVLEEKRSIGREIAQALPRARHHQLDSLSGQRIGVGIRRIVDRLRRHDVLAVIAVVGRLRHARAGPNRLAEAPHLRAGVVHVVLPLDVVAGVLEDATERVPVRGVARGGDVQRPGGVRAHELRFTRSPAPGRPARSGARPARPRRAPGGTRRQP